MQEREHHRELTGRVEIDDAYLGGERKGKPGRGSPNEAPKNGFSFSISCKHSLNSENNFNFLG